MFRSVARMFPLAMGGRLASTMVSKPAMNSVIFNQPLKPEAHFIQSGLFANNKIAQGIFEINDPISESSVTEMIMTSVLRKRRLKMKKHKLRKRRKAQRALMIKIGK